MSHILKRHWAGKAVLAGLCLLTLPAGATGDDTALSADRQAVLDRQLGSLVRTGEEMCINRRRISEVHVISDNRILFRVSRSLIYDQQLMVGCPGMARSPYLPVPTHTNGSQLCAGDTIEVPDSRGASCTLSSFSVWQRPAT